MRHIETKRSHKEGPTAKAITIYNFHPSEHAKKHMQHKPYTVFSSNDKNKKQLKGGKLK